MPVQEIDAFLIGALAVPLAFIWVLRLLSQKRKADKATLKLVVAWNVVLLLSLLSVLFVSGEMYYRFGVDTTDTFSINKISQRWFDRYYEKNNLNTRDNIDYPVKRTPGKRRVTIIGDSFSAGHGIKDVEDRLGNLLREIHPDWEVHIMALNGIETDQQLEFLPKFAEVDGYEYDIVLLAYCLNDIVYLTPGMAEVYDKIYAYAENLNWLERNSYFVNTLTFRLMAMNDPSFADYWDRLEATYSGNTWVTQQQNLARLQHYIESRNAQLMVITWPFLNTLGPEYRFQEVHQKLGAFWQAQQVPHLDLLEVFDTYYPDQLVVNEYDAHPNELANAIATTSVSRFLTTNVRPTR